MKDARCAVVQCGSMVVGLVWLYGRVKSYKVNGSGSLATQGGEFEGDYERLE